MQFDEYIVMFVFIMGRFGDVLSGSEKMCSVGGKGRGERGYGYVFKTKNLE